MSYNLTPKSTFFRRGKINAAVIAGSFGGMAFGSSLFGAIAKNFGYNYVFLTAALFIILIIIFPLFVKDVIIVNFPIRKIIN